MHVTIHPYSTRRKGRATRLTCYETLKLPALRSVWLLSIVPAFVFSCISPEESVPDRKQTQIYITKAEKTTLEGLDLFFFYPEEPMKLDSYQHFGGADARFGLLHGGSTEGERRVAAVANLPEGALPPDGVLSFRNLSSQLSRFGDENPASPVMTGAAPVVAGSDPRCEVRLRPLLVRIGVHTLCCDFHGRPYEDALLEDVRIYLTYVKASAPLFDEKSGEGWINEGGLSESDLSRLAHPETVFREIKGPVGETVLKSDINLFCYPNGTSEEDLANRWTRLVIEGKLEGETCYYPVVLGPVEAGTEHIFDFVITRRGTSGPDIPADSRMIRIRSRLVPWQETDPKTETY